jgi:hypothetical protein
MMISPIGNKEADAKLWYRAQTLRRISTDLVNALGDAGDDETAVLALIAKAIEAVNGAADILRVGV